MLVLKMYAIVYIRPYLKCGFSGFWNANAFLNPCDIAHSPTKHMENKPRHYKWVSGQHHLRIIGQTDYINVHLKNNSKLTDLSISIIVFRLIPSLQIRIKFNFQVNFLKRISIVKLEEIKTFNWVPFDRSSLKFIPWIRTLTKIVKRILDCKFRSDSFEAQEENAAHFESTERLPNMVLVWNCIEYQHNKSYI